MNGLVPRHDPEDHRDANMFPYWAEVPLTAWLQITTMLVAAGGWLTFLMAAQGVRG